MLGHNHAMPDSQMPSDQTNGGDNVLRWLVLLLGCVLLCYVLADFTAARPVTG